MCTNSERVNALLQRGESLIQRCHTNDAQHLETQLLELLQRCSLVHNNIACTHTRLLSMRLVRARTRTHTHTLISKCTLVFSVLQKHVELLDTLSLQVLMCYSSCSLSVASVSSFRFLKTTGSSPKLQTLAAPQRVCWRRRSCMTEPTQTSFQHPATRKVHTHVGG